jgi:ABC-2 type transport system permease protein
MSFFEVFVSELKRIFTDVALVLTIIGGVVLYSFLYPQPYINQSVSSLPISVVDLDKTQKSRDLIFKLDSTPQIDVIRVDVSQKDAQEALLKTQIKGMIIIPKDFAKDLSTHKTPTIAVGVDNSYFLVYGGVLEGAMKSILTQGVALKVATMLKNQLPLNQAKKAYAPYSLKIVNFFNPQNSYTQYVIPAVFILILQQTMLIGLGILGGGINESLKSNKDGYFRVAPIWMMILSRFVIFGFVFFIHMLFYFGFSFEMFGITHLASIKDLLCFGVVFLAASISFGIFLGSIFSCREVATPLILFSSLPLVFSAGFVWPKEAINDVIIYLSMLVPSTPAIDGFLKLNQMGANFSLIMDDFTILLVQIVIYTFLGYYFINKKRKNSVKI